MRHGGSRKAGFPGLLRWRVRNVSDGESAAARVSRLVSIPVKSRYLGLKAASIDFFPG